MGQILRIAVVLHVLFSLEEDSVQDTVSTQAIGAAINFVEVCCQQTAYIAGRGSLEEELKLREQGF